MGEVNTAEEKINSVSGAAGQVKTSQGPNLPPVWATISAGPDKVVKSADETLNNDNTLQNDDELFFALAANEVWAYLIIPLHQAGTTPDIKFGATVPAGASLEGVCIGLKADGTVTITDTPVSGGWKGTVNPDITVIFIGIVINGANAGNFQLQWAQNTATVEDTTVKQNSCLIMWQLV